MEKLTFSTTIRAPRDKVWRVLLDDATYRQWVSPFCEGSWAETDWKQGSPAKFVTPDGSGMISRIAEHRPNEFISIEHLGMLDKGQEVHNEMTAAWAGALENYSVNESGGVTTLTIELDTTPEHTEYFEGTWPKALKIVKDLAENGAATA